MPITTTRRWWISVVVGVAVATAVLGIVPLPNDWPRLPTEPEEAKALFRAYSAAVQTSRSSSVPVTAVTYDVILHDRSPDEIQVVFVPRPYVVHLVHGEPPEEINVVLRRSSGAVLRVYFGE